MDKERDDRAFVETWLGQIADALKREKSFRKKGRELEGLYEATNKAENSFNILYSNTETLLPALYNNPPRPVVERRFRDADPVGKLASEVAQRTLEFLLDRNDPTFESLDSLFQAAVLAALVPGRGQIRFRYEADIQDDRIISETVVSESVPWNGFCHGFGTTWAKVPWVAFEHFMSRQELVDNFGEIGQAVKLDIVADEEGEDRQNGPRDSQGAELAQVWEIWDKTSGTVFFIAPGTPDIVLKEVEDPLGLSGFFPCPEPLTLTTKLSSLIPVPLYAYYEEQARELNRVNIRINKLITMLKVRGMYDATIQGIERVLQSEDGALIPADNVAAMQQGQTLEKALWLMPLEKVITVLQQLYVQREQVKQIIYEITGISDILRGASVASETATAQNIKNQWGTLRLKRMQKRVQAYVRDCLRIIGEIAVKHLQPQTILAMTGVELPSAQMLQSFITQAQMTGQPLPADLPPSIEDVLELLREDSQRQYRIDVETNSTVDVEATEDKQNLGEFMNALAQYLNGMGPLVEKQIIPFDASKAMLMGLVRRYRFGPEVEDELAKMQPPVAPQAAEEQTPDPEAQVKMEEAQMKLEMLKAEMELQKQEHELKLQKLRMDMEFAAQSHAVRMQKLILPEVPQNAAV